MVQEPLGTEFIITDQMRQLIGWQSPPYTREVEKGAVRKYADAIGDPNPLYRDEEYARKSAYGGIIVPPTFLTTFNPYEHGVERPPITHPRRRGGASAGDRYEYYLPVKVGDTITCQVKVADVYEREGRTGRLLFSVHEMTFTNQHGQMVAKRWWTSVSF